MLVDGKCFGQDDGFWLVAVLLLGLALGLAAVALAALGSRLARPTSIATLTLAVLLVVTGALVGAGALPAGGALSPRVVQFHQDLMAQGMGREAAARAREEYRALYFRNCVEESAVRATMPLLVGLLAFGLIYARARAARRAEDAPSGPTSGR